MVQEPAVTKVKTPLLVIVQTPVVLEVKVRVRPEVALADRVGIVPKFCAPGLLKVMVWGALGMTLLLAAEAEPVPTLLEALTVKV
jgi:hypothetical protein